MSQQQQYIINITMFDQKYDVIVKLKSELHPIKIKITIIRRIPENQMQVRFHKCLILILSITVLAQLKMLAVSSPPSQNDIEYELFIRMGFDQFGRWFSEMDYQSTFELIKKKPHAILDLRLNNVWKFTATELAQKYIEKLKVKNYQSLWIDYNLDALSRQLTCSYLTDFVSILTKETKVTVGIKTNQFIWNWMFQNNGCLQMQKLPLMCVGNQKQNSSFATWKYAKLYQIFGMNNGMQCGRVGQQFDFVVI